MKANIEKNKCGYYIEIIDDNGIHYNGDRETAKILNTEKSEYRKILIERFKANKLDVDDCGIYFKSSKDVEKAISEYIEPRLVMRKLCGDVE